MIKKSTILVLAILMTFFSVSCSCSDERAETQNNIVASSTTQATQTLTTVTTSISTTTVTTQPITTKGQKPKPKPTTAKQEESVIDRTLKSMTLEQKVGQMFIVCSRDESMRESVDKYQFGGLVLFSKDFEGKTKETAKAMIDSYQKSSKTPMIVSVDEEGGEVNRVSLHKAFRETPFMSPQELYKKGGFGLVESDAKEKAQLLLSLGINVNLAPVSDVAHNGSYIFDRTFGDNVKLTNEFVSRVVTVNNQQKLGSVLKHFPGYGDNENTHTGIAYDNRPYSQFEQTDFLPFISGIKSGAGAVLVSHNIVKSMDANFPASLSPNAHKILREKLGFDRVIMTDDLYMDAIKDYTGGDASKAAIQAIKAGNDLLCCSDFNVQIPAAITAVKSGEISIKRVEESVRRILEWKQTLGIIK